MSQGPILAIETSGPVGSIAVQVDGEVRAREFLGERGAHARAAIPAIERCLGTAGLAVGDLAGVVVGAGPGSFTGVRVAAAVGKGLASAAGIPLWAVSSLRAAARTEAAIPEPRELESGALRGVLFDARGGRLFAAGYRDEGDHLVEIVEPHFTRVEDLVADDRFAGAVFCGDGAVRNADHLGGAGRSVLPPPLGFPSADGLLRTLRELKDVEPVDLSTWEPTYLRASNAERERQG